MLAFVQFPSHTYMYLASGYPSLLVAKQDQYSMNYVHVHAQTSLYVHVYVIMHKAVFICGHVYGKGTIFFII